jgi:F-type H+-transporting ATPase subunit gamma
MSEFRFKKYDRIVFIYNRFKNAATQQSVSEQFLPILPPKTIIKSTIPVDYIFEPDKQQILDELVPKTLKIQLYKVILDSWASEQGARMTAMHKATDNATEILKQLRLSYNKARQAAITNEILEIVGGAEALKG